MNPAHPAEAVLDSRQLRAFVSLARHGSFTRAARQLHLSQSAISHAMKALEQEVGCRLLDRLGKKVALTQAGEQLFFHAERILREMAAARQGISQLGRWGQARLRVAASGSTCQYLLPTVIREFKAAFPDCALTIEPADRPAILEMLRAQRVDLAFALAPNRDEPTEFHPLFEDELMFIISALHPWAVAGRVDRGSIGQQKFILYQKSSRTFEMAQSYFHEEGLTLTSFIEFGSMEAIKELVKAGLGVSVLAPWVARKELEEGSLVALPLGRRRLRRHWGIVHWRERRLTLAEETFVGLCRSVTEKLREENGR